MVNTLVFFEATFNVEREWFWTVKSLECEARAVLINTCCILKNWECEARQAECVEVARGSVYTCIF